MWKRLNHKAFYKDRIPLLVTSIQKFGKNVKCQAKYLYGYKYNNMFISQGFSKRSWEKKKISFNFYIFSLIFFLIHRKSYLWSPISTQTPMYCKINFQSNGIKTCIIHFSLSRNSKILSCRNDQWLTKIPSTFDNFFFKISFK